MYSRKVVERNLRRASEILIRTHGLPKGWRLKRSSAEEIAEMREHFDALLDDKGIPVRKLTREDGRRKCRKLEIVERKWRR